MSADQILLSQVNRIKIGDKIPFIIINPIVLTLQLFRRSDGFL